MNSSLLPHRLLISAFAALLVAMTFASSLVADEPAKSGDPAALRLFEERIMPIFKSPKPSSCVQCHLSSVDIKDYILPSHVETFIALREGGLVNVDKPEESKILKLIQMGEKDLDRGARLIHSRTRKAEFEAFSAWINACCADPALAKATAPAKVALVGSAKPLEVVRHGRKSRLAESFTRNVWSQRMRCFPCHTPNELDANNPKHKMPIQRQADLVKKFGQKMNIFQKTPEATMARLISGSRRHPEDQYPLINVEKPNKSLLLLKPISKLPKKKDDGTFEAPSSFDPVSHMGGLKMHVNDQSYKSFMLWLQDYSDTVHGRYATAEDLPKDNWIPTKRILRVKDVPESWGDLTVVQLFVYAADDSGKWTTEPIAFTQGTITPRRLVNGALFVVGTPTKTNAAGYNAVTRDVADTPRPLRPGKYLIKAFVDSHDKIAAEPAVLLGEDDFVGQAVIDAQWRIGFPKAQTVSAREFAKE